ncbi:hypothetical protein CFP56_016671, partial [Quercus suber]
NEERLGLVLRGGKVQGAEVAVADLCRLSLIWFRLGLCCSSGFSLLLPSNLQRLNLVLSSVSMRLRLKRTCSGVECFAPFHIKRFSFLFLFLRGVSLDTISVILRFSREKRALYIYIYIFFFSVLSAIFFFLIYFSSKNFWVF